MNKAHHSRLLFVCLFSVILYAEKVTAQECTIDLEQTCSRCFPPATTETTTTHSTKQYNCSFPGLREMTPGKHEGVIVNYLSFVTETSSPNLPIRATEFQECTGATIVFSEANNAWEDPIKDLGNKNNRGSEVYDGYFMSSSHFPEVSALGLAENLNDRIRLDNARLKWEDVLPMVRAMSTYRKDGATNIDFLMYDGDFFVPIIRLDLLEKYDMALPNTWEELLDVVRFFHGKDLNDDGNDDDYGFCHFPRLGAGYWDWWWPEAMYSTWATYDQTHGTKQGFFFDADTMEPRLNTGFRNAAEIWKVLWTHGEDGCISTNFITGRCAVGYAPPGCWKSVFLDPDGINRKDENGTVIWQPKMKSGQYAEPYRFKPFGSTHVYNRKDGQLQPCTSSTCPYAEKVPSKGHIDDNDLASVLKSSPLQGQLVNRAPFFWSGGLGTLIRKSSTKKQKDAIWDFFVYTNSPDTSVHDVANYASWLDAWRYSQLARGDNFVKAGWSQDAFKAHSTIMLWALTDDVRGVLNLRIPGIRRYTWDGAAYWMSKYIEGVISLDEMAHELATKWNDVTNEEGKLNQLEVYRSGLGLDPHSELELCRLHLDLMDQDDPSICNKYGRDIESIALVRIFGPTIMGMVAIVLFFVAVSRRRQNDTIWAISRDELTFGEPPEVLGRGTFGLVLLAEYRGTQVAVKRVIPPKISRIKRRATTYAADSSMSKSFSIDHSRHSMQTDVEQQDGSASTGAVDVSPAKQSRAMSSASASGFRAAIADAVPFPFKYSDKYKQLKADFIQEMRYLSKLRHPCITTVMGAVIANTDDPMLVMEYMDHGSLYDILHNDTIPLDGDFILPVLRDIAQGVRFLHAATPQVIHGDLKAQNVLVDSRFRAKVADFGLSCKKTIGATGTPLWMAPELLSGKSSNTSSSDVYSFGIILYEVYSRKDPYEGEDYREVLKAVVDKSINKRPPVPHTCPATVAAIMTDCLVAGPELRPSFEEIDTRLKRLDVRNAAPSEQQLSHRAKQKLEASRNKDLLFQMFPRHIAEALRDGRKVEPEKKECVTVFFADIVGFTTMSAEMTAEKASDMLDRLYLRFDELADEHGVFKMEVVGDAYMCATNLVKDQTYDHVERMALFSIGAMEAAKQTLVDVDDPSRGCVEIRAGFHSGPVIARVLGSSTPKFSIFGDTVNTASRMESSSVPGSIQCSERSANLLKVQCPGLPLKSRGRISVKGKGEMHTYFVNEKRTINNNSSNNARRKYPSNERRSSSSTNNGSATNESAGDRRSSLRDLYERITSVTNLYDTIRNTLKEEFPNEKKSSTHTEGSEKTLKERSEKKKTDDEADQNSAFWYAKGGTDAKDLQEWKKIEENDDEVKGSTNRDETNTKRGIDSQEDPFGWNEASGEMNKIEQEIHEDEAELHDETIHSNTENLIEA